MREMPGILSTQAWIIRSKAWLGKLLKNRKNNIH